MLRIKAGGREYLIAAASVHGVAELVVKPLESKWTRGSQYIGPP